MTTSHEGGVLVDDHLLLLVLLGQEPAALRPTGGPLATTGLWYHRLCRALADTTVTGAMSRRLGDVPASIAAASVQAVLELPDDIGLVSLRDLAAPMAALVAGGVHLNLLSLEAIAAAEHLGAAVLLAEDDENPALLQTCADRGIPHRLVAT